VGALLAGPVAAWAGVPATEYGAAGLILVASGLALLPREIRTLRAEHLAGPAAPAIAAALADGTEGGGPTGVDAAAPASAA
jgi:hypothetical protein